MVSNPAAWITHLMLHLNQRFLVVIIGVSRFLVSAVSLGGGFWVEVRFKDYSSRLTYIHIYFEFWLWEVSVIYWERNPLMS